MKERIRWKNTKTIQTADSSTFILILRYKQSLYAKKSRSKVTRNYYYMFLQLSIGMPPERYKTCWKKGVWKTETFNSGFYGKYIQKHSCKAARYHFRFVFNLVLSCAHFPFELNNKRFYIWLTNNGYTWPAFLFVSTTFSGSVAQVFVDRPISF